VEARRDDALAKAQQRHTQQLRWTEDPPEVQDGKGDNPPGVKNLCDASGNSRDSFDVDYAR
jgi:hypothetical protein